MGNTQGSVAPIYKIGMTLTIHVNGTVIGTEIAVYDPWGNRIPTADLPITIRQYIHNAFKQATLYMSQ